MARYIIVNGSPIKNGRSAQIARGLAHRLTQNNAPDIHFKEITAQVQKPASEAADNSAIIFDIGSQPVNYCIACDCCKETQRCVLGDHLQQKYSLIDAADVIIVVSPVYFAGPTAQLKAFLDRMQPYFWNEEVRKLERKAFLFVVREGGDPHGFDPLLTCVKSSLAVAGFKLQEHIDCIGVYDEALEKLVDSAAQKIACSEGFDSKTQRKREGGK